MANASLRWGRIVLGGFLAEILLILAVIPVYATGGNQTVLTTVAVAGSFLAFIPVAWWLARTTSRPVLHGTLMERRVRRSTSSSPLWDDRSIRTLRPCPGSITSATR